MDRLIIDYLKEKGKEDMKEQEFKHRFKDFMTRYRRDSKGMEHDKDWYHNADDRMNDYNERFFDWAGRHRMDDEEIYNMMKYMRHSLHEEGHFSDSDAKYIVSQMYHIENGRKHSGEKYDMYKAKEICERYRGIIPPNVTHTDLYIAINSQYHDYSELFKSWFGDNIDTKIIESAISFWFKDVDYKEGNKIWNYFKEL